jgi:hypothetical protein
MKPGTEVTRTLFHCDLHTALWVERHGAHIPEMISKMAREPKVLGKRFWWAEEVEKIREQRSRHKPHPHDKVEGEEPTVVLTDEASTVVALLEFGDGTVVDLRLPMEVAQELIEKGKANDSADGPSLLERIRSRFSYRWY